MAALRGPVEYVVIDFPGNKFNGAVAPAIADLVDRGLVRILDLVFVKKDPDGLVSVFEFDELDEGRAFADIDGDVDGLLGQPDLESLTEDVPPDSSALFVLWEDLWAAELGEAVRASGGELVGGGRIPHRILDAVVGKVAGSEAALS